MAELAYQMMQAGANAGRQVDETQMKAWLRPVLGKIGVDGDADRWLETFVQALRERNSVLDERGGQYAFIHLTFQEYLCAYYLAEIVRDVREIARFLLAEKRVLDPWWRETILLTVGYLGLNGPEHALTLIRQMTTATASPTAETLAAAELAAAAFLELDGGDTGAGDQARDQLKRHLADTCLEAPPLLRLLAGDALNGLGDDRPGVLTLEPDIIPIPAGKFLMGDKRYEVTIHEPFAIARFPVTNGQYRRFVEAGGYTARQRDCWTENGWAYRDEYGWREPRYWADGRWNRDNQPVVGVSWYEAVAFCRWLTAQLQASRFLQKGQIVRLPTEAEWERAARHTDGRAYPWGEWREGVANSKEAGLERTTAVGVFPANATVSGVLDMSGNVWEWCQTRWRDEKKDYPLPYQADDGREELAGNHAVWRVRRGGSYYSSNKESLRCACRVRHLPDGRFDDGGFRVCVSPFSTSGL